MREKNKKIIENMSLEEIEDFITDINYYRNDIYVEYITTEDFSTGAIEKCKDCDYNLLDLDTIEEFQTEAENEDMEDEDDE